MADKKNYIYYTNTTDKLIQKRLDELNKVDEEEYSKNLSNQKMIEEITSNVIKALSKDIVSIVSEQVSKIEKSKGTSFNELYSNSMPDLQSNLYYEFDEDLTKGQNTENEFPYVMDERMEDLIPIAEKLGYRFEHSYNSNRGKYDIYLVDKNGKKFAISTKAQKQPTHPKSTWFALYEKFLKSQERYSALDLFAGIGGVQSAMGEYLLQDDEEDFSNYKVKSNIGFFLDKQNLPKSALATRAGISRGTILSNLEEANGLSLLNAYKISKVLGVPLEQLFVFTDDDDEEHTDETE